MSRDHWKRISFVTMLTLVVFATGAANAAPIVHGDFPADTVDYLGVQEESSSDPGDELFGPPTIGGDSMDFNPQAFAASSTGADSDITDSNLQFLVMAHANRNINSLTFSEAGDTTLTGLAGEAQTTVGAIINMEITELNIAGVLTPVSINVPQVAMPFIPKDNFLLSVDGAGTQGWTGDVVVDLSSYGTVTKVFVSLDNALTAASVAGTSAFIQKKDADAVVITVETGIIPEPGTVALAMIAVALGSVIARRRK
jgi:hypothetical protein